MMRMFCLVLAATLGVCGCKSDVMTTGGASQSTSGKAAASKTSDTAYTLSIRASQLEPGTVVTPKQIQGWLETTLTQQARFKLSDSAVQSSHTAQLKVDYRAGAKDMADGSGQIVGSVLVDAVLTLRAPKKRSEVFRAEAFVGEALPSQTSTDEELAALVQSVVEEVGANLVAQIQIRYGSDKELLSLLTHDSPEVLAMAIEEVRSRGLKQAAPQLKKLLEHTERNVVNRSASALGELGTRDMVPALIDAGSRVEPLDRLPVLYALGELGGPESVLYLETLSGSVTDPTVKQAALNALERAKRTADDP